MLADLIESEQSTESTATAGMVIINPSKSYEIFC